MKYSELLGMTKQTPKIYLANEKKTVHLILQSLKAMQEASHYLACAEMTLIAFEGCRKIFLLLCALYEICICT